jgi:alpha-D-ribose 1-methylphosphonate 5-triphosphate diphosphatase
VPASLLLAAFHLPRHIPTIDLAQAIGMVTKAAADATGLTDRGEIAPGRRADLVRVTLVEDDTPLVRRVWSRGRIAA